MGSRLPTSARELQRTLLEVHPSHMVSVERGRSHDIGPQHGAISPSACVGDLGWPEHSASRSTTTPSVRSLGRKCIDLGVVTLQRGYHDRRVARTAVGQSEPTAGDSQWMFPAMCSHTTETCPAPVRRGFSSPKAPGKEELCASPDVLVASSPRTSRIVRKLLVGSLFPGLAPSASPCCNGLCGHRHRTQPEPVRVE